MQEKSETCHHGMIIMETWQNVTMETKFVVMVTFKMVVCVLEQTQYHPIVNLIVRYLQCLFFWGGIYVLICERGRNMNGKIGPVDLSKNEIG